MALCLVLLLGAGCNSSSSSKGRNASVRASDNGQESNKGPTPGSDQGDYVQGNQPVPVNGSGLVDFDNARIRCDYKNTTAAHVYDAQCVVVAHLATGRELVAGQVTAGVSLTWQPPAMVRGDASFADCKGSANALNFNCTVTVTNPDQLAEVGFGLQVRATGKTPRIEPSSLLLPYSVSLAAGFVPSMPYQYKAQSIDPATGKLAASGEAGFQHFGFAASDSSFPFPNGICRRGDKLYFADAFAVYEVSAGQVAHYAGSANSQNMTNTSDKLRAFLLPSFLACTADAVYVSSPQLGRIYKLTDSGSVQIIADNGLTTNPPASAAAAAALPFLDPRGLAVDPSGTVVFADLSGHRVRFINSQGQLGVYAGTGATGYSGDGGPATAAVLTSPVNVAIAADGSVYISDVDTATVRKVAANGTISTVAGTGVQRYSSIPANPLALAEPQAVAVDPSGAVYVSELFRGVKKIMPDRSLQQVLSAGSELNQSARDMRSAMQQALAQNQTLPSYGSDILQRVQFSILAVDAGGTFYTEGPVGVVAYGAGSLSTPTLYTGAPQGLPADCQAPSPALLLHLAEASAIGIAPDHSLIVADWQNTVSNQLVVHSIYAAGSGNMSKALYGCRGEAQLVGRNPTSLTPTTNSIGALAVDKGGAIYLASLSQNKILKMDTDGTIATIAGTGANAFSPDGALAASATIQTPIGLSLAPDGSVYFVEYPFLNARPGDSPAGRIRRISPQGQLSTLAGTGTSGDASDNQPAVSSPIRATTVAAGADGRVYFTDYGNAKIKMIDQQGLLHTIAGVGLPDASGRPLSGAMVASATQPVDALRVQLWSPSSIAVSNDSTVYFVDYFTNQVLQLKQRTSDGGWDMAVLFGVKRTADCGTATTQSPTTAANIATAIKSSLSVICEGKPRSVTVRDTCPAVGGETRIAITQGVDSYANIIQIVKPCGT